MAIQQLTKEFKELKINPPEGFNVELVDDDVFVWEVGIFGTPETIYEGAYLKAILHFPSNYPFSPFKMTFITEMWHPNVFEDGKVCISILHPPGEDPLNTFERPEERWSPAQTVSYVYYS
jgi:ubiquitin-protein ligase